MRSSRAGWARTTCEAVGADDELLLVAAVDTGFGGGAVSLLGREQGLCRPETTRSSRPMSTLWSISPCRRPFGPTS